MKYDSKAHYLKAKYKCCNKDKVCKAIYFLQLALKKNFFCSYIYLIYQHTIKKG